MMNNLFRRLLHTICFLSGIFCLIFALFPYTIYGILNAGVWALFLLSGGFLLRWVLSHLLQHRQNFFCYPFLRFIKNLLSFCLGAFIVLEILFSVPMVWAASYNPPKDNSPQTVIVLGCLTRNGEPSLMLSRRIEAAFQALQKNPETVAVTSGGYSPKETLTQAEISKNTLINMGIEPSRIFIEPNSEDTDENLKYSAKLIEDNDLSTSVVIATDGFHQLRGALYAKTYGLFPTAVSSKTPWGLLPSYWVREQGGLVEIALKQWSHSSKIARKTLQILTKIK